MDFLSTVLILVVVVAVATEHALEEEDGVVAVVPIIVDQVVLAVQVLGVTLDLKRQ